MSFKVMTNRICDPAKPKEYKENTDWLTGLFGKCSKCKHPKGWHDTELWSKDESCIDKDCGCKEFHN